MIPTADETGAGNDGIGARPRTVFVNDFVHCDLPFAELVAVLCDPLAAWLHHLGAARAAATAAGDELPMRDGGASGGETTAVLRIGPRGASQLTAPLVAVSIGAARVHPTNVILPMKWEPVSFGQLLPILDADLELSDLGSGGSRLAISGRYRVPLGSLGLGIDRIALHRVAEASIRNFLVDLQEAVQPR